MAATFQVVDRTFTKKEKATGKTRTFKRYYANLYFDGKKTMRLGGYKWEDANALGHKLCSEYNQKRGGVAATSKKSLEDAVGAFLDRKLDKKNKPIKENTKELYRVELGKFIEATAVETFEEITAKRLVEWATEMKVVRGNMPNTININLRVIKCFLNFCMAQGWLDANPFPVNLITTYEPQGHYFTEDEMGKLMAPIPYNPKAREYRPTKVGQKQQERQVIADRLLVLAISIARVQGLRLSQIWSLKLEDYRESDSHIFALGLKRKDDKFVLCHPVTIKCLREAAAINKCGPGERVFKNWGSAATMSHAFADKCEALGINGRFHDLKHTAVSDMKSQGLSNVDIEAITNTDRKTIDAVYTHSNIQKLKDKFFNFLENV